MGFAVDVAPDGIAVFPFPALIAAFPPTIEANFEKPNKLPTKNTAKTQTAAIAIRDLFFFFLGGKPFACLTPHITQNTSAPSSSAPHDLQNLAIMFYLRYFTCLNGRQLIILLNL
jgi:hypothetical protein